MTHATDQELIDGLRRGDEAAYRDLVRLHQNRVFTIALRMIGDREEAADVAQDIFVTVFRSIRSFRGDSLFSTWLYRVAMNRTKNHIKYMHRRRQGLKVAWDARPGWEPTGTTGPHYPTVGRTERPDDAAATRELTRRAVEALGRIDQEFREALVLHEIEGVSYEEIAAVTGVPEGTVKSRIHRARAALRKAVLEQGALPEEDPE